MKLKPFPIFVTLASLACLGGAMALTASGLPGKGPEARTQPNLSPQVAVQTDLTSPDAVSALAPTVVVVMAQTGTHRASVQGYGEASPHFDITYSSEVNGRVETLGANFETGSIVKKGEILVTLENSTYLQAVSQAKSDLAQAELDLLEEERSGEQAKLEWQRSGLAGEPNSALVLREPQLASKTAAAENAKYSLQKAIKNLNETVIKAPFDALIVTRNVQPGSYIQSGATVAVLYSTDRVEIEVPLSVKQWQSLPTYKNVDLTQTAATRWPVTLYDSESSRTWDGYVSRIEQHVQSDSRQRSLIVSVDQPFKSEVELYPGTFVQAQIDGRILKNTWKLPASAISQEGDIWFVDEANKLNKVTANKYFERAGAVYVAPMRGAKSAQIVKRPLTNYVVGMQVVPQVEG